MECPFNWCWVFRKYLERIFHFILFKNLRALLKSELLIKGEAGIILNIISNFKPLFLYSAIIYLITSTLSTLSPASFFGLKKSISKPNLLTTFFIFIDSVETWILLNSLDFLPHKAHIE